MKVIHMTSVHVRYDTRIFVKECRSLVKRGYEVHLIVADGNGDENKDGVAIHDIGASPSRLSRMTSAPRKMLKVALQLQGDIYHLHDPELMPIGIKLKTHGQKVIFDAHEDLPKQILGKPYLNRVTKKVLSVGADAYERRVCPKFDGIVTATPYIRDKFLKINARSVDVNNYPSLEEMPEPSDWSQKRDEVVYVGAISRARGVKEIVGALEYTEGVRLNLGGNFVQAEFENEVQAQDGWSRVNELGFLARDAVKQCLSQSKIGLVTLHPLINYLDALPVKMFEYMAAGIPFIASDIPLWRSIAESNNCGICVDPLDPKAIGEAIMYLLKNPDLSEEMGRNGRKAVENLYNWDSQSEKLAALYESIGHSHGNRATARV